MTLPATLRALRYRNFQLFFGGQLISLIGTWMQNVAQAWLVYKLTGSSVLLGLVSFSSQIPVFLMSPLGGIVADRFRRRRVVIGTQTAAMLLALVLAALTLTGAVQVWHVVVLSALLGVVNAFDIPARQAFFVEMVGREDLINAIALNSSMFNASRVIGPAVAGILVAAVGEGWCFFANGVSYIAVIAGLLLMTVDDRKPVKRQASPLADVIEGFRFVIGSPPIHHLLILLGILSATGMPFAVLMPIFADRILHGGAKGLGILMGASGVGALAGALLLASRQTVKGLGRWVAIAAGSFGASLIAFAVSRSFWTSCALLLPVGFAMMVEMGSSNTLIQTMSPDHLRGRVMSVYSMMFMGMAPLGAVLSGLTAARWGAPATITGGGVICMAAAVVFGWRWPGLRAEARRLVAAAQPQQALKQV
ncbi:MAG TPA: MFS transporter [Bryobacteraceae bacterium]|nr:MFS transporter [Bryobacteraceae bacterium]